MRPLPRSWTPFATQSTLERAEGVRGRRRRNHVIQRAGVFPNYRGKKWGWTRREGREGVGCVNIERTNRGRSCSRQSCPAQWLAHGRPGVRREWRSPAVTNTCTSTNKTEVMT